MDYSVKSLNSKTMKKLIVFVVLVSSVCLGMVSCNIDSKKTETTAQESLQQKDSTVPCCEVSCRRGSCRSYSYPCNCTCVAGQPICGGVKEEGGEQSKDVAANYKVVIEATQDMLKLYDDDIEYIAKTLGNAPAADALRGIKQLFLDNNFTISSEKAVKNYWDYLKIYSDFIDTQSEEVIDRLSSLE